MLQLNREINPIDLQPEHRKLLEDGIRLARKLQLILYQRALHIPSSTLDALIKNIFRLKHNKHPGYVMAMQVVQPLGDRADALFELVVQPVEFGVVLECD